mgnify:CR=1 FL=1|tara:strand:+ start:1340 stop:1987 length:648 start_codon:yes stop_codon:yes gene_type:complete
MSFQTIVNIQQSMNVNNRRVIGQQISRAGYITTAQYLTAVPWVFTIEPHSFLYYPDVRNVIQSIDNADRENPQNITFDTDNLAWFTQYQGDLTTTQVDALTLDSVPAPNAQTISVGNLPSVSSTKYVFKAGDFLQLESYVYKVTADVLRGSLSTVSVNLHRPVIGTPTVGTLTAVGRNVIFPVVAETCPTYTLKPMANGAYVEWSTAFVFREYIV